MPVIHPSIFQVMEQFPEKREKIVRCFKNSESFRVLCDDYKQCSETLRFWSRIDSEESVLRKAEYEVLLQSLKGEILMYVKSSGLQREEL